MMAMEVFLHSVLVKAVEVVVAGVEALIISVGFSFFACVLLLDYLKEFEKNLLLQRHHTGDEASIGLA